MIKKQYSPNSKGNVCRVTFELPKGASSGKVALCGEFNNWDCKKHILKGTPDNGNIKRTILLKPGEYRFKYLYDENHWENEPEADRYEQNPFGTTDSVIEIV